MKAALIELIDFEKVNILLEGFNKTTGFVTAILDLDGNVLSKSGWRQMCTDFHRINPETSKKCTISDTELANNIADGKKYHFYKCLNGLVDVAVPIVINGEHIAYLFSGQFFFEEPDHTFFKKQAEKYGFDEKKYLEALAKVPVVTKEKVEVAMDFLLNMTQLISESTFQKLEQTILNKALKQSEERFQMLFNKAPLGYQSLDIDGHFIEVNQQWLDTLGYERDEVIGKWFGDFLTPMFQDGFRERFPIFKAQGHIHSEFEMVHKNGSILFIAFDGRVGNDTDGNFMQTHCILQDNTESKRVKEALLEAEWKFKALFELGPIGVAYHKMIYDEAGNPYDYYFIDANESYNELTGVNPNGMTVRQAFPGIENDPSDWIGMFGKVAKTGETIRFEQYLESNGRWYDCVGYQYKPDHFVAAFNEITKRKKAEIAMKASEEKFRNFFENTVVGKSITTIDGNLFVNNSFCQIVGYSEAELKNLNWRQITHKDDIELNENIVDIILNGEKKSERWEKRYIHKDGHIVWTDINTTLQRDDDGNPLYFITAIVDISDKKSTEASLRQSEEDFRNVIELSPVPMAIIHEWKTIYFNPAAVQLFGAKSQSEILDKHIYEFIHPDFQDLAIKNSIILAEKGYVDMQEQKYIKLDGSILDVEVQAKSIRFNNDHATLIVINDITERKIAEKTLKKSEERYSSLLLHLETGIVVHAADTSIIKSNPRASELLGLSNDQMLGKTAIDPEWKFIDIGNKPMLVDEYPVQRISNSKQAIRNLILGIQQSMKSDIVWVNVNGFPVLNNVGEITEIVISFNDVSESRKAEKALKESEELLSLYIKNSPIYSFIKEVTENESKVLYASENFTEMIGIPGHEMIGKTMYELFPPEFAKKITADDWAVHKTSEVLKLDESLNGRDYYTIKFPIVQGERNLLAGFTIDITERKNAEQALKESEEKLSTLFSSMTEMVVMHEMIFDEKGEAINYMITDCNKAFSDITGIRKEAAVGRLATEVYRIETAPYLKEYATVCATGISMEFNTHFAPMEKHFLISVVSIGKNRFSTISTDITTNEQIQAIIKEKNKELENYIYVASHDLRSPLVNIQGFSQRLQKQTSQLTKVISEINLKTELASEFSKITTVEIPKSLDFILNNVSKMDTLINGLLQLSRTGQIKINVNDVNMNNLFRKIIAVFNFQLSEYGAEVKIHKIIDCYGDENQLNQLFSNIISNALKYRDRKRKLNIEISSIMQYNKVIYTIKDTGIGMNQRHLERIWDVFYRVDASAAEAGEGLGLSLAKRIVDKHKGKIWAESVEGVGSTFFVELHRNNFEV